MSDARERLLEFVERVEREHVNEPAFACSGSDYHVEDCFGGCARYDQCSAGCEHEGEACDAARAAEAIRAIAEHFGPESRAWSDANVQVLMQVGADALGKE
jgi:hypothetical protein